jgi:geranylgeranyl pyrophosphate synthase
MAVAPEKQEHNDTVWSKSTLLCAHTSHADVWCALPCCAVLCCAGEFTEADALPRALQLVEQAGGIAAARELAEREGQMARDALQGLTESDAKRSLMLMVDYVLDRIH